MGWHGAYKPRKFEVGEYLLSLRTRAKLTQVELAALVGVSHRSVQGWEAGIAYPQEDKLRQLISVFLAHGAFALEEEDVEAYALWQLVSQDARRQLAEFDEEWFAELLANYRLASEQITAPKSQDSSSHTNFTAPQFLGQDRTFQRIVDWGEAPDVPVLHGREAELATLQQWVVEDRCRVVALLGLGGIGKTGLAMTIASRALAHFDAVFFRSLRNAPPLTFILDSLIQAASVEHSALPESVVDKIALLIQLFRERRYLVVLDNLETVLQPGVYAGEYRTNYEEYGLFLQRLGEIPHASCLLLTSREKPSELGPLEGRTAPVRSLVLTGLANDACRAILAEKELFGTEAEVGALANIYGGNALALKLISESIHGVFGGNLDLFLSTDEAFFNGVGKLLDQQFQRSTVMEQVLLYWLAIEREFVNLEALQANFVGGLLQGGILTVLESLRRRLLIERRTHPLAFSLQPVIMEYLTDRLVEHVCHEIVDGQPQLLRSHTLVQATAKDHMRRSQEELIATPLLEQLITTMGGEAAVEQLLLELLQQWRGQSKLSHSSMSGVLREQGYGPGNVVNLLRLLRGHLRGLDLAGLAIRQAYLQGLDLQDSSLAHAVIQDSVFSETFDSLTAVAISIDGAYWAAASRQGEIRMWAAGGLILRRAWRAHNDMVYHLTFSPDGRTLASGGWGGALRLWDVERGALLWSRRHANHINGVAFAPVGTLLASNCEDATIQIWDRQSGALLQTVSLPVPVSGAGVPWSPDGRWLATGDLEGNIRLWEVDLAGQGRALGDCVQTWAGHTTFVDGLAFSPDGNTLASASFDGTVKLWDVSDSERPHLKQMLAGHTNRVTRVAWSADGRLLASSSYDQTVRLWDVEQGSYRAVLQGHTAGVVGLAFTPNGDTLISGSEDGALRVWEVATGQCLRVLQGYAASVYDIDWSPDGARLVSGGSDGLMTIWDVTGGTAPRVLQGHGAIVIGVGWSPDGRWLASCAWDNAIRLWDPTSGTLLQLLQHPDDAGNFFDGLAWSPHGLWLAGGTYQHGVLLFDLSMLPDRTRNRGPMHSAPARIRRVAWSPDATQLAGGGDDCDVYVWHPADGRLLQRLAGHHHSTIMSVAWSADGMRLASSGRSSEGGELFVWEPQGGTCVRSFVEHSGIVAAVAWGSSEDVVISGGGDGRLRWWDVQSGTCVQVRKAHQGTVQSLKRSPDGTKLASCGDDGAVMLWDLRSGDHLQTLRRDRPYERMDITGLIGVTEAQRLSLLALGAVEQSE